MAKSRLSKAKNTIGKYISGTDSFVFTQSNLSQIFWELKDDWSLGKSSTLKKFISFLVDEGILEEVIFMFPRRKVTLHVKPDVSVYEMASSITPGSYFTHHTAMFLHGLVEGEPNQVYVNKEQGRKPSRRDTLEQKSVDTAFSRSVRISRNIAQYNDYEISLLNGMYTGGLGVEILKIEKRTEVLVTNIERTLIDIVVRPSYSGGVQEVLNTYRTARDKLSVTQLQETLRKMDFTYPYHQAIGFYLETSGKYSSQEIRPFEMMEKNIDFYLDYQMKKKKYSSKWRVYYPEDLM